MNPLRPLLPRILLLTLLLALTLGGCQSAPADPAPATANPPVTVDPPAPQPAGARLTLAYPEGESRPLHSSALALASQLEPAFSVELYPDATLGGDEELIGWLLSGGLDLALPLASAFSRAESDQVELPASWATFAWLDQGWRWEDATAALAELNGSADGDVVDGGSDEVGAADGNVAEDGLAQRLQTALGEELLIFGYVDCGPLLLCSSLPLETPRGYATLRFALFDQSRHQATVTALGAASRSYRYFELYEALAQGQATATLCPAEMALALDLPAIAPYVIDSGQGFQLRALVGRAAWYQGLTLEQRTAFDQAAADFIATQNQAAAIRAAADREALIAAGAIYTAFTPEQRAAFRAALTGE